jgi:NAD(P)-dependent dehydrogenase (short-subunit alcohol dehydrogenase family)
MPLLSQKVAIITGAGSGIGRASALRFAEEGASVVVADIRGPAAEETVAMIDAAGGKAMACQVNVVDSAAVQQLVDVAVERFGGIDALFNNAGTVRPGNAMRLSVEDWDLVMAVNVRSVFLGAKYAVPVMAERGGGTIVSTASVMGLAGSEGGLAYGASKAALINLTRCLAVDHAQQGIRVNCICPGLIETPPAGGRQGGAFARRAGAPARASGSAGGDRRGGRVVVFGRVGVRHRPVDRGGRRTHQRLPAQRRRRPPPGAVTSRSSSGATR